MISVFGRSYNMKKIKKYAIYPIVLIIGLIGGFAGAYLAPLLQTATNQSTTTTNSSSTTTVSDTTYDNETSTTQAVETVQNAVVSVINYQTASSNSNSIFSSGESSDELEVYSEGSGVIYKKDGDYAYLVTNTHVIEGAEAIDILMADGTKVEGELVGSDTYSDIAVVRISAEKVSIVAEFADSDSINVGETAIAIGSPLGIEYANSVTEGIVSSLSRTVTMTNDSGETVSTNAIQTDAAINPGNSGGPLINIEGQVIGITSSKISSSSSGTSVEGMGFAIPANDVVSIINQLETDGKVTRPALGIQMVDITALSTNQLQTAGLADTDLTSGVVVVSTQSGLPADGVLEQYDVITAIDGETIESTSDLQSALFTHSIGDTIEITIVRNGEEQTVQIELTHSTEDLQS